MFYGIEFQTVGAVNLIYLIFDTMNCQISDLDDHNLNVQKLCWIIPLALTVKLRYKGLAYNLSVIVYISSESRHFSIQNMSVSTYLDLMYPWLLQTDF